MDERNVNESHLTFNLILRQDSPCVAQGDPPTPACSRSANTGIFHYSGVFFLIIEGKEKNLVIPRCDLANIL